METTTRPSALSHDERERNREEDERGKRNASRLACGIGIVFSVAVLISADRFGPMLRARIDAANKGQTAGQLLRVENSSLQKASVKSRPAV
jgi:hypothetical protein